MPSRLPTGDDGRGQQQQELRESRFTNIAITAPTAIPMAANAFDAVICVDAVNHLWDCSLAGHRLASLPWLRAGKKPGSKHV